MAQVQTTVDLQAVERAFHYVRSRLNSVEPTTELLAVLGAAWGVEGVKNLVRCADQVEATGGDTQAVEMVVAGGQVMAGNVVEEKCDVVVAEKDPEVGSSRGSGAGAVEAGEESGEEVAVSVSSVDSFCDVGSAVVLPAGGLSSYVPSGAFEEEPERGSFFATYVRTPEVKALRGHLLTAGIRLPQKVMGELALARYSQATVPPGFDGGKEKLKVLAKVGDNALTLVLSDVMYSQRCTVSVTQGRCSKVLCASNLSRVCVSSGLSRYVSFASGIDVATARPAGEALEAIAGVIYHSSGVAGVHSYMKWLGLLE